jgi:ATPase subunit of ABC transporter with duplicated ATPase domains
LPCSGVDLGVDLDSRVAIVGANGTGKSTLLKLMTGQLEPLDGLVKRHNHLRIGVYHQHLVSHFEGVLLTAVRAMLCDTWPCTVQHSSRCVRHQRLWSCSRCYMV